MAAASSGSANRCRLVELDGPDVVDQEAECSAGFDRGQLGGVTEEPDDGAAFACVAHEPVEPAGSGHPCFVDEDQVSGLQREPRILECAVGGVGVLELVQVLRAAAELGGEDLGGCGRGRQRYDAAARRTPCLGDCLHGGGLACAGGADADDEAPGVGCEPEHQRPLAIVQGQVVALLEGCRRAR